MASVAFISDKFAKVYKMMKKYNRYKTIGRGITSKNKTKKHQP